jgi:Family of unknown function (DUF5317)
MILIVLALLCVLTVPLRGGNLARLADLQLRGLWLPVLSLVVQVAITEVVRGGSEALHRELHIFTYVMLVAFLWLNRRLPGLRIVALGALLNMLAIVVNRGVMPASATAERLSGLHLPPGFDNSAHFGHELLPFLGDIIPWPGPLPNVLSIGDLIIFAGTVVLLHRACGRDAPRLIQLRPITDEVV